MLSLDQRIEVFSELGASLRDHFEHQDTSAFTELDPAISLAFHKNGWFTRPEVEHALRYWGEVMSKDNLREWITEHTPENTASKRVGLVLAGNIPLVGFHDVLSTMLSGHVALLKCSSSDDVLIPTLLQKAMQIEPGIKAHFELVTGKLSNFDAIIATGSNNSARYFESYFGKYPNIIRKNRTGIGILQGTESEEEMQGLMADSFRYYGLGCRNVTKLFLPKDFDLNKIFRASLSFGYLQENKKYANNYTYHKALMIMEKRKVLDNELLLLTENESLFSPVSVMHYEYYESLPELDAKIEANLDHIQCVVGSGNRPFGSAQKPSLNDYADGVNTLDFLANLQ